MVVIPLVLPAVMLGLIVALGRYEDLLLGAVKEAKHRGPRRRHLHAVPPLLPSDRHTRPRSRPRHAA
ncbi:hypothetical protein ACFVTY_10730 [Streptomyces sp. NPDC058067]|uniref:hypothetical protein n=1 Tax=Streptomyces sp. NPDC058067 TaxID=3346324 RepID=UPI0036DFDE56